MVAAMMPNEKICGSVMRLAITCGRPNWLPTRHSTVLVHADVRHMITFGGSGEGDMGDFNRRTVLAASAALAATSGTASAQAPAARQKGPVVWLDMDQQELDD